MKFALGLLAFVAVVRIVSSAVVPITDPSEARYSIVAREMARDGDYVTPRLIHDGVKVPFLGKPPLYFWIAALATGPFGEHGFAYRLPSLFSALLCVFLVGRSVKRLRGTDSSRLAMLLVGSSGGFLVLSGYALLDMTVSVFVAWGHLALLELLTGEDSRVKGASLELGIASALGMLAKGPVALVMMGIPVVAFVIADRSFRLPRRIDFRIVIPVFLVIASPWFLLAEQAQPGFLRYFFINENLLRYLVSDYGDRYGRGHRFPYGSAIWMFVIVAFPWSIVAFARRLWRREPGIPRDRVVVFAYLGTAAMVGFLCFSRQLLVTYLLPAIPLFAVGLAVDVPKGGAYVRNLAKAAALFALVVALALPLIFLFHPGIRTSKPLFDALPERISSTRPRAGVCFLERTPYSAHLYGNMPIIEGADDWRGHLADDANRGTNLIYLLRKGRYISLPAELRAQLDVLGSLGDRVFLVTRAAPPSDDR